MSDKYSIFYDSGITKVKFLAKPSFDEVKDIIDVIVADYPYEKRLWDMTDIKFDFTLNEIKLIAEYGKRVFTKPNKLSIVTDDDLAYGEMRQFMVYREQDGRATPIVFRKEEDAIKWLLE